MWVICWGVLWGTNTGSSGPPLDWCHKTHSKQVATPALSGHESGSAAVDTVLLAGPAEEIPDSSKSCLLVQLRMERHWWTHLLTSSVRNPNNGAFLVCHNTEALIFMTTWVILPHSGERTMAKKGINPPSSAKSQFVTSSKRMFVSCDLLEEKDFTDQPGILIVHHRTQKRISYSLLEMFQSTEHEE